MLVQKHALFNFTALFLPSDVLLLVQMSSPVWALLLHSGFFYSLVYLLLDFYLFMYLLWYWNETLQKFLPAETQIWSALTSKCVILLLRSALSKNVSWVQLGWNQTPKQITSNFITTHAGTSACACFPPLSQSFLLLIFHQFIYIYSTASVTVPGLENLQFFGWPLGTESKCESTENGSSVFQPASRLAWFPFLD